MNSGLYTVRRGDTLTRIAKQHGTTPQEIADLNHLSNLNLIRVGQKLVIPGLPSLPPKTQPLSTTSVIDEAGQLWLTFVDAVSKPIKGLKVVVTGLEREFKEVTDARGTIPVLPVNHHDTPVAVSVGKAGGGTKKVADFKASRSVQSVVLTSPKIKVPSQLQPHAEDIQKDPPHPPHAPGTVIDTRSPAGHPVKQVALECPNKENLRLGSNSKYRDILLSASARSGFSPQAIAALLDAEAAPVVRVVAKEVRDKSGKPVIDSETGRPKTRSRRVITGEWDANSKNNASSACGVSQVLDGTWIQLALSRGTFLNARAKKEGWITTATTKKYVGQEERDVTVPAFKLSDGKLVTKTPLHKTLSLPPHLAGRASASDKNLQDLLNLRFDVECAIHTAVDYGKGNMRDLSSKGYRIGELNEGEKAKIMYLCHHLGSNDASRFIDERLTDARARYLLKLQVGGKEATERAMQYGGDYVKAHRYWLAKFIDNRIKISNHACHMTSDYEARDLFAITASTRRRT